MPHALLPYSAPRIEQQLLLTENGYALSSPTSTLTDTITEQDTDYSSANFWE